MQKLQCPICKSTHELLLASNKHTYRCPSCERLVRKMPPATIKPRKRKTVKVTKPSEVVTKAIEEVVAQVETQTTKKNKKPKKDSK